MPQIQQKLLQTGTIRAPEDRAQLEALIRQRDEMQGQLRTLEERRFQLAEQHSRVAPSMAVEIDRRVKALDANIDQLTGRIQQANDYITAGQARFGGTNEAWAIKPPAGSSPAEAAPAAPAAPAFPTLPPEFLPNQSRFDLGRALALEGAGFLLLGAIAWVWVSRRFERKLTARAGGDPARMVQLQQSVDAIALEVERISENQRWVTKVINEKALGAGEARPVDVGAPAGQRVPSDRR